MPHNFLIRCKGTNFLLYYTTFELKKCILALIFFSDYVTERDDTGELALLGGECGVSRTNQDFVCLLWGKVEEHVAQ